MARGKFDETVNSHYRVSGLVQWLHAAYNYIYNKLPLWQGKADSECLLSDFINPAYAHRYSALWRRAHGPMLMFASMNKSVCM